MGRSVSFPSGAYVAFAQYDTHDALFWFMKWFQQDVAEMFPSVSGTNEWLSREDHVLCENTFCKFGLSVYGGLIAYWMVPNADNCCPGLAQSWVEKNFPKFHERFATLHRIGVMSNGEVVYEKIHKE